MSLGIAIKILEHHQRWREGLEQEMVAPHKLTAALQIVINHAKQTQYADV
jgi:hypothetical protein